MTYSLFKRSAHSAGPVLVIGGYVLRTLSLRYHKTSNINKGTVHVHVHTKIKKYLTLSVEKQFGGLLGVPGTLLEGPPLTSAWGGLGEVSGVLEGISWAFCRPRKLKKL